MTCPKDCGACPTLQPSSTGSRRGTPGAQGRKSEELRKRMVEEAARINQDDVHAVLIVIAVFFFLFLAAGACFLNALARNMRKKEMDKRK